MSDAIFIRKLRVPVLLGVPDEERAVKQEVAVTVEMVPGGGLRWLGDEVRRTVDYHEVAGGIAKVAAEKPRKLLETLAEDLLGFLLGAYPLERVTVEVEKFVLPDAEAVSVKLEGGSCP